MSLSPQFSDALASHFPASSSADRSTTHPLPTSPLPTSPVPFTHSAKRDSQGGIDRRSSESSNRSGRAGMERRQFGSSHTGLSSEGRELAAAIDAYKLEHRRRYITCDEMLVVLRSLGYAKATTVS